MAGKHLEFPEQQTHDKKFEQAILATCVVMIVFVIIAISGCFRRKLLACKRHGASLPKR